MTDAASIEDEATWRACWLLSDKSTGVEIGGIQYEHAPDGNHYQPWILVDGDRRTLDLALPQLDMAARAIEDALRPPL